MELALAMYDGLTQFLALLYHPCGVFLAHLNESSHQFLHILGVSGTDGPRIFRVGVLDEIKAPLAVLPVQRVTRLYILQFYGTTDITCHQLVYGYTVGSSAGIDGSYTLLRTSVGIS